MQEPPGGPVQTPGRRLPVVESKNIQGASIMKLQFHPGTDMSAAMAEVVAYVNRSRAFMPPGTPGPFITRFDAGNAYNVIPNEVRLGGTVRAFSNEIMKLVDASGVRAKLDALQSAAEAFSDRAERTLLDPIATAASGENPLDLFFTREEGDEIY